MHCVSFALATEKKCGIRRALETLSYQICKVRHLQGLMLNVVDRNLRELAHETAKTWGYRTAYNTLLISQAKSCPGQRSA